MNADQGDNNADTVTVEVPSALILVAVVGARVKGKARLVTIHNESYVIKEPTGRYTRHFICGASKPAINCFEVAHARSGYKLCVGCFGGT